MRILQKPTESENIQTILLVNALTATHKILRRMFGLTLPSSDYISIRELSLLVADNLDIGKLINDMINNPFKFGVSFK